VLNEKPSLWITHKENGPRGPSAVWWVLTTANAAENNSLTAFRSTEELKIINFGHLSHWIGDQNFEFQDSSQDVVQDESTLKTQII
jgi:hypothetical protein